MPTLLRLLILIIAISTAAGCSGTSSEDHIAAAQAFLKANDPNSALIEIKNALAQDPKNSEARLMAGNIHLTLYDGESAEKELQRALSLGESPGALQPLLAQALYIQNDFDAVLEIDPEQAWLTPEGKADIRAYRGMSLIAKQKHAAAEAEFKAGQIEDRDSLSIITGFGWLAAVRQDIELAREIAGNAMAMDANNAEVWSLLGSIEQHEKKPEAALKAFQRAVKLRPAHLVDNLQLIALNLELGKLDAARGGIFRMRQAKITSDRLDYLAGMLSYHDKEYDKAQHLFEEAIQADSNDIRSLFYAGASALELGRYESAVLYLSRFNGRNPGFLPAMKMLAWLEVRLGNYAQAEILLRKVLQQEPEDAFSLNLLADALAKEDRAEASVEVLRELVKLSPDSAVAQSRLGFGMMSAGMVDEGLAALQSSHELDPNEPGTAGAIVFTLLGEKRFDEALETARELRKSHPGQAYAATVLATVHLQRKEFDAAKQIFEETLALEADNITARSGLGSIAVQAGRPEDAKRLYREILAIQKGNLSTALNLAYLNALDGETQEMEQVLDTAIELNPNALLPRISLAKHYESQNDHARVVELLEPVQAYSGDSYEYLKMLTQAQYRTGKFRDARGNLQRMTQYAPTNTDIRYMYAVTLRRTGDATSAKEEILQVLESKPEHIGAHFQLAELQLNDGQLDNAQAEVETLRKLVGPESLEFAVLEGTVASAASDHSAATAAFKRAFALRDTNFNLLNLENATWDSGNRSRAVELLENWLEKVPADQLGRFRLGERYTALGQTEAAVNTYQTMLEKSPNSAAVLNNLAWVLRDTDPEKAQGYAQRALERNPEAHEIKSTLAVVLKNRDNTRAKQLIREALEASRDNPSYLYYQALIFSEANSSGEAQEILNRLLLNVADFPERDQAQALLNKLQN